MEKRGVTLRGDVELHLGSGPRHAGFDQAEGRHSSLIGNNFRGYEQARGSLPRRGLAMAHEIAKLLLEKAGTFLERTEAIKVALQMGMPLNEIREYLDWLDSLRPLKQDDHNPSSPGDAGPIGQGPS